MTMLVAASEIVEKTVRAQLVRVNPADYFAEEIGDYGPEGGEDGDADSNHAGKRLGAGGSDAGPRRGYGSESSRLIELRGQMAAAESVGDGAAIASLALRAEIEAGTLIAGIFADCGYDSVGSGLDASGAGFDAELGRCACVRVKIQVLTAARNRRAGRETING
jgi:hypothetical protein